MRPRTVRSAIDATDARVSSLERRRRPADTSKGARPYVIATWSTLDVGHDQTLIPALESVSGADRSEWVQANPDDPNGGAIMVGQEGAWRFSLTVQSSSGADYTATASLWRPSLGIFGGTGTDTALVKNPYQPAYPPDLGTTGGEAPLRLQGIVYCPPSCVWYPSLYAAMVYPEQVGEHVSFGKVRLELDWVSDKLGAGG